MRNKAGLLDAAALERFERGRTFGRLVELRAGAVTVVGRFDLAHLQAIRAHVFQDVYRVGWPGARIPLFKSGSAFCQPEQLTEFAHEVFDRLAAADHLRSRPAAEFVNGAADLLADLNALHPFRESNGRSERAFVDLLARYAGQEVVWPPDLEQVNIAASVSSRRGDNRGLVDVLSRSVTTPQPVQATAAQIGARSLPRPRGTVRPDRRNRTRRLTRHPNGGRRRD